MPNLDVSELNATLGVFSGFLLIYGTLSTKFSSKWYLGEALPALLFGIIFGPVAANFIDSEKWGSASAGQTPAITWGLTRVMIGLQLVIVGFQLPAKYQLFRWKATAVLLIPVMTIMWLCSTACILAAIPKVTLLSALVIASCFANTDPILSQAIAKGPFADSYVRRDLREIISSEGGANEGFCWPFLMLAVFLMRHAEHPPADEANDGNQTRNLIGGDSRPGGGAGVAIKNWVIETWIYQILLSIAVGAVIGFAAQRVLKFALRLNWIDAKSYLLYPTTLGLFLLSICGMVGTDDLLACFVAGCVVNWDGDYLAETEALRDEVNNVIDSTLNFAGFMYIGMIIPWAEFNAPDTTGITWGRLIGLGFMVLIFRRIPAILLVYKFIPEVVKDWKEALFLGYFGPMGAGTIYYVEHARRLFPPAGERDQEEADLMGALIPVVYFLVLFSIVVHGLSIPVLNLVYKLLDVRPIQEDAVQLSRKSPREPTPANAVVEDERTFIAYNRFSRPLNNAIELPAAKNKKRARSQDSSKPRSLSRSRIARIFAWTEEVPDDAGQSSSQQSEKDPDPEAGSIRSSLRDHEEMQQRWESRRRVHYDDEPERKPANNVEIEPLESSSGVLK